MGGTAVEGGTEAKWCRFVQRPQLMSALADRRRETSFTFDFVSRTAKLSALSPCWRGRAAQTAPSPYSSLRWLRLLLLPVGQRSFRHIGEISRVQLLTFCFMRLPVLGILCHSSEQSCTGCTAVSLRVACPYSMQDSSRSTEEKTGRVITVDRGNKREIWRLLVVAGSSVESSTRFGIPAGTTWKHWYQILVGTYQKLPLRRFECTCRI
eukprot:894492-Rhodomonas_salina.3